MGWGPYLEANPEKAEFDLIMWVLFPSCGGKRTEKIHLRLLKSL
jgi:hypothetical protein